MRCSLVVVAVFLTGAAACNLRSPGASSRKVEKNATTGPAGRSVETFATPLQVVVGAEVTVNCVVRLHDAHLAEAETVVTLTPDEGPLSGAGSAWSFAPTTVGTIEVRCRTLDGEVVDERGVHVEVLAGEPVVVETQLDTSVAEPGVAVAVTCQLFDAFANLLEEERATGVDVDPELMVDPAFGSGFVVRGTTVGDYNVACRFDLIVDETPEPLTIVAGIPAASETTVDQTLVAPSEVVNVTCEVADAYGNPLTGVATTITVIAGDGSTPTENGLALTDATFSATRSGVYYVFCLVPGNQAGDESPEIITVNWGLPCTWAPELTDLGCFWQGRTLPVTADVMDFWGNLVEDAAITLTDTMTGGPLPGVTSDGQGGWVFGNEGYFDVTVSVVTPPLMDPQCSGLTGAVDQPYNVPFPVLVDSTGPVFAITSPVRSAMLVQGNTGNSLVTITGSITDAVSNITALTVNGVDLSPAGTNKTESIGVNQMSRWGLNIAEGTATDDCGNRTVMAQAYLRSGTYFPTPDYTGVPPGLPVLPVAGRASQGLLAQLNQPAIDSQPRTDLSDIASIGEAMIAGQDFNTLFPPNTVLGSDPLQGGCSCQWWKFCTCGGSFTDGSYTVRRHPDPARLINWSGPWICDPGIPNACDPTNVGYAPTVGFEAVDGGMWFGVQLKNFDFPLQLDACQRICAGGCSATVCLSDLFGGPVNAWAGADRVDATGVMGIGIAGAAPQVSVPSFALNTSGLYFSVGCGAIQWVCDWALGLVVDLLAAQIENALATAISDQIPGLVQDMLAGFTLDTGFTVPPPIDMQIEMSSGLDRVLFCGSDAGLGHPAECPASSPVPGFGQLGLYSQVYPAAKGGQTPDHDCSAVSVGMLCGAIRKDGTVPTFNAWAAPGDDEFGLGIKDDMFNQILWAMWYGGGLDLPDLGALVSGSGIDGVTMSFFAGLPPVVMPGTAGNQIDIGIGDAYIDAVVDLATLTNGTPGTGLLNVGLYLSTTVGGSLGVTQNQTTGINMLEVTLEDTPMIHVEVVTIDDPAYQAVMSDLFRDILALILPELLQGVLGSFPIPEIDLGSSGGFPPGTDTVWTLTGVTVGRTADYFELSGSLE